MSKSKIDCKKTHFECPELTQIHGQPTPTDLITLKREVRANASTVHTTLGGGYNRHLGMTCTPQVYATVPNSVSYQHAQMHHQPYKSNLEQHNFKSSKQATNIQKMRVCSRKS